MARLYSDENFDYVVVEELRRLGHDVVTCREAGLAGQGLADPDQLAFATAQVRVMLTFNRRHFIKLHQQTLQHKGIVVCTGDRDCLALAQRIHQAITAEGSLENKLIRITRPP